MNLGEILPLNLDIGIKNSRRHGPIQEYRPVLSGSQSPLGVKNEVRLK